MNSSSREKGIAKPRKTVSFWAFGCLPITKSFRKVRWKVNGTRSIGISEKSSCFPDGMFQTEIRVPFLQSPL